MSAKPVSPGEPGASDDSLLSYRVATRHFQDRVSNLDISRELGISRFRVARLLDQAVNSGLVNIKVAFPYALDERLSAELATVFGIRSAQVLADESDLQWRSQGVAAVALHHVAGLLNDGGKLGIAWGSTLDAVMRTGSHMQIAFPRADVVQLVGGVPSRTGSLEASDLVRRWSLMTGGESIVLNAPLIVPRPAVAEGLLRERSVAATLAAAAGADVTLSSIGAWSVENSRFQAVLSVADRTGAAEAGAFADYCGILISRSGDETACDLTDRIIGIRPDALRRIPRRVAVVLGHNKASAACAALRSGLITDLVLDADCAKSMLRIAADTTSSSAPSEAGEQPTRNRTRPTRSKPAPRARA